MTSPKNTPIDRDEVELLLPWYVSGTLDRSDAERVEAFLADTSEFDVQIATMREDIGATVAANEAIRGPSAGALDRLMTQIEAEPHPAQPLKTAGAGLLSMVEGFLHALTPGRLGMAAMAAAALIVIQAGLIGGLVLQEGTGGATYNTASGETQAEGTYLLVGFNAKAGIGDVTAFLEEHDAMIVSGPQDGDVYKVRVGTKKLTEDARTALIEKLSQKADLVTMVLPSSGAGGD